MPKIEILEAGEDGGFDLDDAPEPVKAPVKKPAKKPTWKPAVSPSGAFTAR